MSTWRIGFLSIAARWWAVVALATGAGGLLAYLYGSGDSPTYEAEAKLHVTAPEAELGALQTAGELAPTYAELVRSTPVLHRTVQALGGRVALGELQENVRGEFDRETRLLTVRARAADPEVAVLIANEAARQLVREASKPPPATENGDSALRTRLGVVEPASDADRVRPQRFLLMQFGAVAGFFLAVALAVFVDSRRRTVRDEEDLTELTPRVALGTVDEGPLSRRLVWRLAGGGVAEGENSYRRLADLLVPVGAEYEPRALLVFGAQRGSGSGTVAANLAATFAATGARVVLADLGERVEAARLFGTSGRDADAPPGEPVGKLHHGGIVFDSFAPGSTHGLVVVLPRGGPPPLLDVAEARGLVELLQQGADVVVIHGGHAPPSLTLSRVADMTLVVARSGRTRRDSVTSTLESLELARANVVGTVLNASRRGA
jgi:capsular polysaccharide biosynthesis protein